MLHLSKVKQMLRAPLVSFTLLAALIATYASGAHAVTGATGVVPAGGSVDPADATVGEQFTWAFRVIGETAHSYSGIGMPVGFVQIPTARDGPLTTVFVNSVLFLPLLCSSWLPISHGRDQSYAIPLLPFSGADNATEIEDLGVVSVLEGISLSLLPGEIFEYGMEIRFCSCSNCWWRFQSESSFQHLGNASLRLCVIHRRGWP